MIRNKFVIYNLDDRGWVLCHNDGEGELVSAFEDHAQAVEHVLTHFHGKLHVLDLNHAMAIEISIGADQRIHSLDFSFEYGVADDAAVGRWQAHGLGIEHSADAFEKVLTTEDALDELKTFIQDVTKENQLAVSRIRIGIHRDGVYLYKVDGYPGKYLYLSDFLTDRAKTKREVLSYYHKVIRINPGVRY